MMKYFFQRGVCKSSNESRLGNVFFLGEDLWHYRKDASCLLGMTREIVEKLK